ncbi:AAA family ATPase [Candidatus Riflebacteria bacterium]
MNDFSKTTSNLIPATNRELKKSTEADKKISKAQKFQPLESEAEIPLKECQELIIRLKANLEKVILGKSEIIDKVLIALLARGHVLLEDIPGIGKTTLARTLAASLDLEFKRIQFTSDLFPSDILGVNVYRKNQEKFEFQAGPIFADIIIADEINRATPKTQSALLEAMAESQVTIENKTYSLSKFFMVFATQNSDEHFGTNPLPESQLDRFFMKLDMGYPPLDSERRMVLDRKGGDPLAKIKPAINRKDLSGLQQQVSKVFCDDSILDYLLTLVQKSRSNPKIRIGVSPRGTLDMFRAVQANALCRQRDYVIPEDVYELFVVTQSHRIMLQARYESCGAESILREILESVDAPL